LPQVLSFADGSKVVALDAILTLALLSIERRRLELRYSIINSIIVIRQQFRNQKRNSMQTKM
jgi:hypothetical protein